MASDPMMEARGTVLQKHQETPGSGSAPRWKDVAVSIRRRRPKGLIPFTRCTLIRICTSARSQVSQVALNAKNAKMLRCSRRVGGVLDFKLRYHRLVQVTKSGSLSTAGKTIHEASITPCPSPHCSDSRTSCPSLPKSMTNQPLLEHPTELENHSRIC